MIINTERLLLREYTSEDFPLFKSIYSDEEIMRYALVEAYKTENAVRSYFNKVLSDYTKTENRHAYEFAVIEKSSGQYLGSADIDIEIKNQYGGFGEIGYFLLTPHWGKGYAIEIAAALVRFCFEELGFHKVCASCNALNTASENVMKKLGMTKEGVLRKRRYKDNAWQDDVRYGILSEEWKKV
jgi:ribosomal-protein-alanine N-acetyltransferase